MQTVAVKAELDRVLASPELAGSDRLCRFLRYVVDAKLNGQHDQLKEILIGREVFDRDADYDPRIDPIVRVEARRLRKKLDDFYAREQPTTLRITLPKGAYVPEFEDLVAAPAAPLATRRRWLIPLVWLASAAEVGCLVYAYRRKTAQSAPTVSVAAIPARWIWPDEGFPDIRHDEDLAERLGQHLARDPKLRVVAWPSLQRFRDSKTKLRDLAQQLDVSLLLVTAVRVESDGFRATTYLIDAALDRKLHVQDQRSAALATPSDRDRTAAAIAADLAHRLY
ncbi:hypothetical protein F183_A43050 [Bryobacterales bacterium F-183]|nr:hypothetical protein F183_A43050 [Bryobacterales bacterium F-183]